MSQPNEQYKELVINKIQKDLIQDVDGFFYFWPKGYVGGHFNSNSLRIIADKLDEMNAPYEKEIDKYFEHEVDDNLPVDEWFEEMGRKFANIKKTIDNEEKI